MIMNKNERFVITINRELGSGGRTVGEKLAQRLGVPFYDKEVIKALQEEYGLTVSQIEQLKGRNHGWWSEFKRALSLGYSSSMSFVQNGYIDEPDLLLTDEMYDLEVAILKGIADSESCVIAGRTAFHILRRYPNHVSVLIQAPLEQRIARLVNKRGISQEEAISAINEADEMRENYVRKYTGTSRYDTRNYDLVISMAKQSEDCVVDLIMQYLTSEEQ